LLQNCNELTCHSESPWCVVELCTACWTT